MDAPSITWSTGFRKSSALSSSDFFWILQRSNVVPVHSSDGVPFSLWCSLFTFGLTFTKSRFRDPAVPGSLLVGDTIVKQQKRQASFVLTLRTVVILVMSGCTYSAVCWIPCGKLRSTGCWWAVCCFHASYFIDNHHYQGAMSNDPAKLAHFTGLCM